MSKTEKKPWEKLRTKDSKLVEATLRKQFERVDAYRYNSASIRVRIIDHRFEGKSSEKRDAMVEPALQELPDSIQGDIMNLLTFAPDETSKSPKAALSNLEFEDPSPSML